MTLELSAPTRYLATMSRGQRRDHGIVYTPAALAEFVLEQALEDQDLAEPLLDPACGAGVFLVSAINRIAADLTRQGRSIANQDRDVFLKLIAELVWGCDIDTGAVALARQAMVAAAQHQSPGPLAADYFDPNVIVCDFLHDEVLDKIPVKPRLIVGNPPYVPIHRISGDARDAIRREYSAASGRMDLYTVFMERSTMLLEPGGSWAFITPDKFLTNVSAGPLRSLLATKGSIRNIARFDSHRVFPDAATVPCVTVWESGRRASHFEHARVALSSGLDRQLIVQETMRVSVDKLRNSWSVARKSHESVIDKIRAGSSPLSDLTSRISAGITTGYNPAFILNMDDLSSVEPELVHRTARGRDIHANRVDDSGQRILVPYVPGEDGQFRLIDIDEFPLTRRWLEERQTRLRERHCVRAWGKAWWDLHDTVTVPFHTTEKVLVPDLARTNRFAADVVGVVPQHSAYYLLPQGVDSAVLALVLNSPPVELVLRATAPRMKDGFSRYRAQFLRALPIPTLDQSALDRIRGAADTSSQAQLDSVTSELFGVDLIDVNRSLDGL